MGATYPKYKTWAADEDLTTADLNAHVDNERNNLTPSGVDDHSSTLSQMKIQTNPGAQGTESQATSLGGELERLRYVLNRLIGGTFWYDAPASTISLLSTTLNQVQFTPPNRIVSGRKRSTSSQSLFLTPDGTASTVNLKATATNLSVFINGALFTQTSDVAITGLSLAPSANNTALVNDTSLAGGQETRLIGEGGSDLTIDTVGSEISNLVGKWAAFKIVGAGTEYFLAYVKSATQLTQVRRGYFFDSADAPFKRTTISNNDTITLMKLTWVFLKNDGTLSVTYNNPVWSSTTPTSPSVGDYWYDSSSTTWKKYNGSAYATDNSILIGICAQNTTGTVIARSLEFHAQFSELNNIDTEVLSNTVLQSVVPESMISVNGNFVSFGSNGVKWDITANLASSADMYDATEQASRSYYAYVKEDGGVVLSDMAPYKRNSMRGKYHPYNTWRFVAEIFNNGSSNFEYDIPDFPSKRWRTFNVTVTAVTANPTKGTTSIDQGRFLRTENGTMKYRYEYRQSVAGADGTGTYMYSLPGLSVIDSTQMSVDTNPLEGYCGNGRVSASSDTNNRKVEVYARTITQLSLESGGADGGLEQVSSARYAFGTASVAHCFTAEIPIRGWSE
ncbi:MAG TPA: hypothetical protein VMZ26_18095 [Pyrinomonadaceae bacterium]|nr:hypothetical protein [Pyrinomonadaceae bacterium]